MGSIFDLGSAGASYSSGFASSANYGSSSFNSTTLYGSGLGSFSVSEGGSYTPISFNY
jgi:hypothetical protein